MPRDDALLLDVLLAACKIVRYTKDVTQDAFEGSEILQDAVMHQIQIIGEAVSRVSPATREKYPDVPWHEIIGMRHRLVHDYSKVDLGKVWEAATESVPALIVAVEPLVPPPEEED